MSDDIYKFIEARIDESELGTEGLRLEPIRHLRSMFDVMRVVLDFHKNWPVLVEMHERTNPTLEYDTSNLDINQMTFRMTRQFSFLQGQEYIKAFDQQPPTTPMLRQMATIWSNHPDFNVDWLMARDEIMSAFGTDTDESQRIAMGLPPRRGNTASNDQ